MKRGGSYLIEKYGKKVGEAQITHSDLEQEVRLAKEYVKIFGNHVELPTLDELEDLLAKGYLLGINLNYYGLYGKKGYAGHYVVVFNIDDEFVHLHDPGLPPHPNAKIPIVNFLKSWEYPDKNSRNYQAFRLT